MSDDIAPRVITVFYAWQSDSSPQTNKNAIKSAISAAISEIEAKNTSVNIVLDEATRSMSGSGNIPDRIRQKIEACDIFVGDVTTVTPRKTDPENKGRKSPNPNVVFEIGYAAAHVGWDRIILLSNTAISNLEDLPFDFDRHRVSKYTVKNDADANGKSKLSALMYAAISQVIDENPARASELREIKPRDLRRKRDIENISWALSKLDLIALDSHIERLPEFVPPSAHFYYTSFMGVILSPLFDVNDKEINDALRKLQRAWAKALSFGDHYVQINSGEYKFHTWLDRPLNESQEKDWNTILKARSRMRRHLNILLKLVRRRFVEIDLKQQTMLARAAWAKYDADDD